MASPASRLPGSATLAGLSLLAGFGIVMAGWDLAHHLGRSSAAQLVFGAGSGPQYPAPGPEWTVVLFFTPMECPELMSVVDRLNQLSSHRLRVRGVLLVDQRRFPGWTDLLSANEITFPVQQIDPEEGRRALEALGDMRTPVVALFDRQHELRFASDLTDQAELVTLIQNAVERDSHR